MHVGGVIVPAEGIEGVTGCGFITTSADGADIQPYELVTVKEYVPAGSVVTVAVTPLPDVVTPPGVRVTVQLPVDGNPFSINVPVDTAQVGCVIVPTTGASGIGGGAFMTTLADAADIHPAALVTVKVYVPVGRPETVVEVPVTLEITLSGLRVNIHVPEDGNPLRTTLPVATVHVGWVLAPTAGAAGTGLTVNVYVAEASVQGVPCGLFVVTVMITVLPASETAGV